VVSKGVLWVEVANTSVVVVGGEVGGPFGFPAGPGGPLAL